MNTIWLKIAAAAVAAVIVIIVVTRFTSDQSAPAPAPQSQSGETDKPKTFYDMAERDKQFLEPPKPAGDQVAAQPPANEQPVEQPQEAIPQPTAQRSRFVLPSHITKPTTLYFKPMDEIAEIEAQRILPVATAGRSIGRLPVTHYNLMQQGCRQILQRWPDSWYAFRAKQMLEEMPERFWRNYKVTYEELDISRFMKPRPGTQAVTVEPKR